MIDLTQEQRRLLATKVMRWKAVDHYYTQPPRRIMVENWQPDRRLSQAFMVAEKAGYLTLTQGSVAWDARIDDVTAFGITPSLAICLAALKLLDSRRRKSA